MFSFVKTDMGEVVLYYGLAWQINKHVYSKNVTERKAIDPLRTRTCCTECCSHDCVRLVPSRKETLGVSFESFPHDG